jgi:hypothetical protein
MEDDELQGAVSSDAQEAQEVNACKSYVIGILTTYGGRTLRQIHDTLKIWVGDQKYTLKLPELEKILSRLCAEENARLECIEGVYQLMSMTHRPGGAARAGGMPL